jgi:Spy/CpxP family protein refolding chaperone
MADTESGSSWMKIGLLGVLVCGAGVYMYAQYSRYSTGLREEASPWVQQGARAGGPGAGARPTEFNRENRPDPTQRMREMADQLNLTPDQRQRMEAVAAQTAANPDRRPGEGMAAMREILTPEQQARAEQLRGQAGGAGGAEWQARRAERMAEREREAREALSPRDFAE